MFTDNELAYIKSQPLARLATTADDGQPDNVPVGFRFDGTHFIIIGYNLTESRKYKNIEAGQHKVALVIDDLVSVDPWQPRGLRVYGTAELTLHEGRPAIQITPDISWSWQIETVADSVYKSRMHRTVHTS